MKLRNKGRLFTNWRRREIVSSMKPVSSNRRQEQLFVHVVLSCLILKTVKMIYSFPNVPVGGSLDQWSSRGLQRFLLVRGTSSMGVYSVRDLEYSYVFLLLSDHLGNETGAGVQTKASDFLYLSPTIATLICSGKLLFDCSVLSTKDLILHTTDVLKLRPVRADSAQHLCKRLSIWKDCSQYVKTSEHVQASLQNRNFPGTAAEKLYKICVACCLLLCTTLFLMICSRTQL